MLEIGRIIIHPTLMIEYLGIIPARKNSKGIKNKHLLKIKEKRVIEYTFENSKNSRILDRTILTTDDNRLFKLANKHRVNIPFVRPKRLSKDNTSMNDVILHTLKWFEKKSFLPKNFVLLQPTSLFRKENDIDKIITKYLKLNSKCMISVSETINNNYEAVNLKNSKLCLFNKKSLNRQNMKKSYFINGSIYVRNTKDFLKTNKLITNNPHYFLQDKFNSFELDEKFDFKIITKILT